MKEYIEDIKLTMKKVDDIQDSTHREYNDKQLLLNEMLVNSMNDLCTLAMQSAKMPDVRFLKIAKNIVKIREKSIEIYYIKRAILFNRNEKLIEVIINS